MRFYQLDALRFLFALIIACAHSIGWIGIFTGAQMSVDFFFVLSGFVLSHWILRAKPSLSKFLIERFARMWPLHIVTMLAMMMLRTVPDAGTVFSTVLLLQGVLDRPLTLNTPSWSISTEFVVGIILFYPVVRWRSLIGALSLILVSGHFLSTNCAPFSAGFMRCIFGCTLGYLAYELYGLANLIPSISWLRASIQIASLSGFLFLLTLPGSWGGYIAGMAIAVALVISFALGDTGLTRALSNPKVRWAGEMSFALYLCHVPVLFLLRNIGAMPAYEHVEWKHAPNVALYLSLSIAVAIAARRFIEQPAKDTITNTIPALWPFRPHFREAR